MFLFIFFFLEEKCATPCCSRLLGAFFNVVLIDDLRSAMYIKVFWLISQWIVKP